MSVSFLVTVYQKAQFLPAVLAAIAAERATTGGEIIVVDDGSTDGSAELLDDFASTGDAITIIHQSNAGVVAATNVALRAARADYIRLMDGDDLATPGSTLVLRKILEESGCGYAYGDFDEYDLGRRYDDMSRADAAAAFDILPDPLSRMLRTQPFVVSATLGRREVLQAILPLPEHYSHQDVALGLKLATRTKIVHAATLCCSMASNAALGKDHRISGSMARMYRDTARVTGELSGPWPFRYRSLAVRRNALRALLYARRHIPNSNGRCVALMLIRLVGYFPSRAMYPRLMDFIATTYDPALRDPASFP